MSKGLMIVISGPSGAGKGTIYHRVLEKSPRIKKSISVTTRAPRVNEVDGVHYHFKTLQQYQQMIANGEFLETASVYNNYYGTPKAPVFEVLKCGDDVMFEIDIHGARQIRKIYPECVTIFIMPPSFEILEKRLRERKTETDESIITRLASAKSELSKYELFDYIVFNDTIEESVERVLNIIEAERSKMSRNMDTVFELLKDKK